jgi:hypothetical protein
MSSAVYAKIVHTACVGFFLGAGYSLFSSADDAVRGRGAPRPSAGAGAGAGAAVDGGSFRARFASPLRAAALEGARSAAIISAGTAAYGFTALARAPRGSHGTFEFGRDAVAVGAGVAAGFAVAGAKWVSGADAPHAPGGMSPRARAAAAVAAGCAAALVVEFKVLEV